MLSELRNIIFVLLFSSLIIEEVKFYRIILVLVLLFGFFYLFYYRLYKNKDFYKYAILNLIYFIGFLPQIFVDDSFKIRDLDHASRFILYLPFLSFLIYNKKFNIETILKYSLIIWILYSTIKIYVLNQHFSVTRINVSQIFLVASTCMLYLSYCKDKSNLRKIYFITYIITIFIIVNLGSRSVILYIIPMHLFVLLILNKKIHSIIYSRLFLTFCFLVISLIIEKNSLSRFHNGILTLNDSFNNEFKPPSKNNSINFRFSYLGHALDSFMQSPILGVGRSSAFEYASKFNCRDIKERFSHHHNEFLSTLANRGIFGLITLIIYFSYLVSYFYKRFKSFNDLSSAFGLIILSSYVLFFLTDSPLIGSMKSVDYFLLSIMVFYNCSSSNIHTKKNE